MLLHIGIIIYISILGIVFSFLKIKNKDKIFLFLTMGFLFLLSALRNESVGNDTSEYIRIFKNISSQNDYTFYVDRFEVGYLFLNRVISLISDNSQTILIATSLIIYIVFLRFIIKYSSNKWFSVFLFFTLGYFTITMTTIRFALAITINLLSFELIIENKVKRFVIFTIIAFLFHRTAIIFLIMIILLKLKFNKKFMLLTIFGTIVMFLISLPILDLLFNLIPNYGYYIRTEYFNGKVRLATVLNIVLGIIILTTGYLLTKHENKKKYIIQLNTENTYIKMHELMQHSLPIMILFGISITFISFRFTILDRLGDYFLIFSIIYLPNAMKNASKWNSTSLISYVLIIIFSMYSLSIIIYRPEWHRLYPYVFFFE